MWRLMRPTRAGAGALDLPMPRTAGRQSCEDLHLRHPSQSDEPIQLWRLNRPTLCEVPVPAAADAFEL